MRAPARLPAIPPCCHLRERVQARPYRGGHHSPTLDDPLTSARGRIAPAAVTAIICRLSESGGESRLLFLAIPNSKGGAGDGLRTRYLDLGKVALYQVSYSRSGRGEIITRRLWRHLVRPRPSGRGRS